MKKVVKFLINLSNILNILACKLQEITLREDFYVYLPEREKPRYIHNDFLSAEKEANRLKNLITQNGELLLDERIEILQVVKRYEPDIPF